MLGLVIPHGLGVPSGDGRSEDGGENVVLIAPKKTPHLGSVILTRRRKEGQEKAAKVAMGLWKSCI